MRAFTLLLDKDAVFPGGAKAMAPNNDATLSRIFPSYLLRAVWHDALDHIPEHIGHADDMGGDDGRPGQAVCRHQGQSPIAARGSRTGQPLLTIVHANDVVAMGAIEGKLFAATKDKRLWARDANGHDREWDPIRHGNDVVARAAVKPSRVGSNLIAATKDNRLWQRSAAGANLDWLSYGEARNVPR